MQGLVPRTVLLNNNNNIAVPNALSPDVDHEKDVTSRHGFTAMVSQLSRIISWEAREGVSVCRAIKTRGILTILKVPFDRKSVFTFARTPAHSAPLQGSV